VVPHQAWTNLRSPDNPDGELNGVPLRYRGPSEEFDCGAVYGERTVAAGVGSFELTYRARDCSDDTDWKWASHVGAGSVVNVGPPQPDKSVWAESFQVGSTRRVRSVALSSFVMYCDTFCSVVDQLIVLAFVRGHFVMTFTQSSNQFLFFSLHMYLCIGL
jgi:hypothetical protein